MKTYHITEWANELRVHYYSVEAESQAEAEQIYRDGGGKHEGSKTKDCYSSDWAVDDSDQDEEIDQ